jgi:hypothetical protein
VLIVWMRPWYRLERRVVLAGLLSRVVALTDPLALQTIPTGRSGFVALSRNEYQYPVSIWVLLVVQQCQSALSQEG